MARRINIWRLARAVVEINRKLSIPRKHRLRLGIALRILVRKNELCDQDFEWHSALVQAAADQPGLGKTREAAYRKVIARYDRWYYASMKKRGYEKVVSHVPTRKIGAEESLACRK